MTYQEFIEQVKEKAHTELAYAPEEMEFYPEGYTSDDPQKFEWIVDCNTRFSGAEAPWLLTDFLILKRTDEKSGVATIQRIAIRKMYEDVEKEGFDAVFDRIRQKSDEILASPINPEALDSRASAVYENIREQLILRPLNYHLHHQALENCVYKKISDFVLVLYQMLGNAKSSLTTSKIMRDELRRWNMADQEEKVMQDALENSMRLFPPCVFDQRTQTEVNFLTTDLTKEAITHKTPSGNTILLSTTKTTNGALALFYPGVIEKMMGIMGGPFVAVFMNINDVMIFDRRDPASNLFAGRARSSSEMGEMLSRKKYLCDASGVWPV